MTSLYAQYILEREGARCIEDEHGFLAFNVQGPTCYIKEFFTRKESRGKGHGDRMWKKLLSKLSASPVTMIFCHVDLKARGVDQSLQIIRSRGFRVIDQKGDILTLAKELSDGQRDQRPLGRG